MKGVIRITPYGEDALLMSLEEKTSAQIHKVHSMATEIKSTLPYIRYTIPAKDSIVIGFDSYLISHDQLSQKLRQINFNESPSPIISYHELPISFESNYALDLKEVCTLTGYSKDEFVKALERITFQVQFKGFLPGFAYMGDLPLRLNIKRRANPRKKVWAGSVAIAGKHIAIYPIDSPGGWNVIGHCALPMINPKENNTGLLNVCDMVKFVARSST